MVGHTRFEHHRLLAYQITSGTFSTGAQQSHHSYRSAVRIHRRKYGVRLSAESPEKEAGARHFPAGETPLVFILGGAMYRNSRLTNTVPNRLR